MGTPSPTPCRGPAPRFRAIGTPCFERLLCECALLDKECWRLNGDDQRDPGTSLALVFADVIDNAVWGEVPVSEFVVASATMFAMRAMLMRAGVRTTFT